MIRKYHNHKLQTSLWHHEEEPHNNHETQGRQTKQSNQLSLSHQDDCKARMENKQRAANIEKPQNPTIGVIINNESTTTERPPSNGQQPKPPNAYKYMHFTGTIPYPWILPRILSLFTTRLIVSIIHKHSSRILM